MPKYFDSWACFTYYGLVWNAVSINPTPGVPLLNIDAGISFSPILQGCPDVIHSCNYVFSRSKFLFVIVQIKVFSH